MERGASEEEDLEDDEGEGDVEGEEDALLVEQYATKLLDFSSQYGSEGSFSYAAVNCLGKPTKFPSYGDFSETFVLREINDYSWSKCPSGRAFSVSFHYSGSGADGRRRSDRYQNFVDLAFQHEIAVSAVYIYETFHPGAVFAVWGGDCRGRWCRLWERDDGLANCFPGHHPRAFSPPLRASRFPVKMVRIVFCHTGIPGSSQIDAVALLGTMSAPAENRLSEDVSRPRVLPGSITSRAVTFSAASATSTEEDVGDLLSLGAALRLDLQSLGQRLLHSQKQPTDEGPFFGALPEEILLQILSYLDLPSLGRCSGVSRTFRAASSAPRLYTRLCLRHLFHLVSDRCLLHLSPKCALTTHLDLSWCGSYSSLSPSSLASFLSSRGTTLTHLRLNNCHSATCSVVRAVAESCPRLQEIGLSGCHLLRPEDFSPLATLSGLQTVNLARTKVGQQQVEDVMRNNRDLRHLRLSSCAGVHGDEVCQLATSCCPRLTSLELWRCPTLTARGLRELGRLGPLLQELDVGWCSGLDAASGCIVQIVKDCGNIQRLILSAQRQLSNFDVDAISCCLSDRLRQLDLVGARHVGPDAVRRLLESCPRMELLDVGYCELLTSEDAHREVCALRRMFPNCHIVNSFP